MMYQIPEPFQVSTPLGDGWVIFVEGGAHDYYWTVAMNDNGALVTFTQEKIRIANSYTHHRGISDERMKKIIERAS